MMMMTSTMTTTTTISSTTTNDVVEDMIEKWSQQKSRERFQQLRQQLLLSLLIWNHNHHYNIFMKRMIRNHRILLLLFFVLLLSLPFDMKSSSSTTNRTNNNVVFAFDVKYQHRLRTYHSTRTTSTSTTRIDNSNHEHSTSSSATNLSNDEIMRYSRHLVLNDVGMNGQIKLKNSAVLIIGAGGLGSPVLLYLAAAGVGYIGIIDNDIVDSSNLQRQIIHNKNTIGISKCQSAKQHILNINPYINVQTYEMEFTSQNAKQIIQNGYDNEHPWNVIVDGSDNFPTKYLINDVCSMYNIPWVYSAILAFEGQVSVFNYGRNGPDYRDMLPIPPPPGDVPSCAEGGVLGILPGTMGCIQATETIKILLYSNNNNNDNILANNKINNKVDILSGRVLVFDALKMKFTEIGLRRDPNKQRITSLIDYQGFCGGPTTTTQQQSVPERQQQQQQLAHVMTIEPGVLVAADVSPATGTVGQRTMDEEVVATDNIQSFHSIEPQECFHKLTKEQWSPYVLDVRLQTEHEIVALPFTDKVVPYRTVHASRDVPSSGDILIYCKGGVRGKKACQSLLEQGIDPTRLYNLNGGILKWQKDIDTSMPRY